MTFLIDADLPRATSTLLTSHGHSAIDVRDVGMGRAKDRDIAAYAQKQGMCLLTGDWGFSDIRAFPPSQYPAIVVLGLPDDATGEIILKVLGVLLDRPDVIDQLPGRLAVVEKTAFVSGRRCSCGPPRPGWSPTVPNDRWADPSDPRVPAMRYE